MTTPVIVPLVEVKPQVREFLSDLDEADVTKIRKALKVYETIESLSWFLKWFAITTLAIVVFITQIKDQVKAIFH